MIALLVIKKLPTNCKKAVINREYYTYRERSCSTCVSYSVQHFIHVNTVKPLYNGDHWGMKI